ncbi:hypothetical protein QPL46_06905 [Escherichia coli]|nr:hypothetical protein [Escherichia coli]MDS1525213.1 hypothetical protein [Escherichia coli]HBH5370435.1 hypothetical protein [Escherichia coli]
MIIKTLKMSARNRN